MADGLNKALLFGNLCADPELKYTKSDQPVLHLRLATNESYLDRDKVRRERTDFHNIVVWGKRGEALSKILSKGSSIFVEGSIQTSSYDDKEGRKVYKTEIVAKNLILGGRGKQGGSEEDQGDGGGYDDRRGGGGGSRGGGGERDGRGAPPQGGRDQRGGSSGGGDDRRAGRAAPPPVDEGPAGGYGDDDIPF